MNRLLFGDNLGWLRDTEQFPNESVDLIYLDPPFNSKRHYNLLFKTPKTVGQAHRLPKGQAHRLPKDSGKAGGAPALQHYSEAQITAFEDSWHWGEQAEREFDEIIHSKNTDLAAMMPALRSFLGENDMMAYLTMMANRLLKPTSGFYNALKPLDKFNKS